MNKIFNKIKVCLATLRIALISFPLKARGLENWTQEPNHWPMLYWVPSPIEEIPAEPTLMDTIIKITPRLLIAITFIVWIVSFIRIRKINDKTLKKKKTKKTFVIMIILITLIIIAFLLSARLLGCTTCWWII